MFLTSYCYEVPPGRGKEIKRGMIVGIQFVHPIFLDPEDRIEINVVQRREDTIEGTLAVVIAPESLPFTETTAEIPEVGTDVDIVSQM